MKAPPAGGRRVSGRDRLESDLARADRRAEAADHTRHGQLGVVSQEGLERAGSNVTLGQPGGLIEEREGRDVRLGPPRVPLQQLLATEGGQIEQQPTSEK